jgi:hypothetical protein
MDIRETYDDVPKCGHCGERVVAEKMFKYWDDLMKVPR